MAEFECKVYKLRIEEHPNADLLEVALVGDYRSIVRKGQYKTGDLGVYIPEAAIVPDWMLTRLGLKGKLAGKDHNRVKAVRLRGIFSQGLIYPVELRSDCLDTETGITSDVHCITIQEGGAGHRVEEGDDVTEWLGVTKYEPPIPQSMSGLMKSAFGKTVKYDIENIKKYPDVLKDGEHVIMTEKIHGTFCCFGYHPEVEHPIVTSKGNSAGGRIFKFVDENKGNVYIRALNSTEVDGQNVVTRIQASGHYPDQLPFYILGEVYGPGIQDLQYGMTEAKFRVFDIYIGEPEQGRYLNPDELIATCSDFGLDMVPILYDGPFSKAAVEEHTNGKESVSMKGANIREGIVIKPIEERRDDELGRIILKSVSEAYLLRRGGTEHN